MALQLGVKPYSIFILILTAISLCPKYLNPNYTSLWKMQNLYCSVNLMICFMLEGFDVEILSYEYLQVRAMSSTCSLRKSWIGVTHSTATGEPLHLYSVYVVSVSVFWEVSYHFLVWMNSYCIRLCSTNYIPNILWGEQHGEC